MARWKALEKTKLFHAHGGSGTLVLWAGKAVKVSKPEWGECTFLRPPGAWIFSKLNFNVGTQYKNGGSMKLASGV